MSLTDSNTFRRVFTVPRARVSVESGVWCLVLLTACSRTPVHPGIDACSPTACSAMPDGAATTDGIPVARISFNIEPPRNDGDYPYRADRPAPSSPAPGSTVHLSAAGSFDPEGHPVSFFWNVQGRDGKYLPIAPDPGEARVTFSPVRVGALTIALEVVEADGLRQIGQATLVLSAEPRPCAADGVSAPCSDAFPVPAGTFLAGSSEGAGEDNERPRHTVVVAPFLLDAYEVTVGRFRRFIDAFRGQLPVEGAGAHPLVAGSGWRPGWNMALPGSRDDFMFAISECGGTWTDDVGASEPRPMTCVTWYEAFAFCVWDGKRLPTEAEWEYAAAGGSEQRLYPWGDDPPTFEKAVYGCLFDGVPGCAQADLPVVGSLRMGAGRWGHLDLAGSVWEWTFDVYAPYRDGGTCDNCAVLSATEGVEGRVFRGGDFKLEDVSNLRTAGRLGFTGGFPDETRGFRCAVSPPGVVPSAPPPP